ncbi:aminoacyl--tRNA ligase-related protein [Nocardia sp. BMG51109]|uniref:aminoacyl--tRNA ligase-related protein n=1 Tax=Nocardia sp. BMG51109 TaxID=1056816 RepID=UPI00046471FB|nr:aminoacyl--tRNA ligase-related protein [Nocardia sp. BMG51109]
MHSNIAAGSGRTELVATGVPGIGLGNGEFDAVVAGLRNYLLKCAGPEPVPVAVPPVISRRLLERGGYVDAFPNLLGTIHSFTGDRHRWRELTRVGRWHDDQEISDLAVLPATCYHLYPLFENEKLDTAVELTAESYCYRHEARQEPGRLRSFRMREFVRISTPDDCLDWRDRWVTRAVGRLTSLGLAVSVEAADDPFFGDAARLMRASQLEQELKWELRVAVADRKDQAVASLNYHKDHFGTAFTIRVDGAQAHTACAAFGLERITLALAHAHGPVLAQWPAEVRSALCLDNSL